MLIDLHRQYAYELQTAPSHHSSMPRLEHFEQSPNSGRIACRVDQGWETLSLTLQLQPTCWARLGLSMRLSLAVLLKLSVWAWDPGRSREPWGVADSFELMGHD